MTDVKSIPRTGIFHFGPYGGSTSEFSVDCANNQLSSYESPTAPERQHIRLLLLLLANAPAAVPHTAIAKEIRKTKADYASEIYPVVSLLRKALGDSARRPHRFIETIKGSTLNPAAGGYRFIGPVTYSDTSYASQEPIVTRQQIAFIDGSDRRVSVRPMSGIMNDPHVEKRLALIKSVDPDTLAISPHTSITEIRYGEGIQVETVDESMLITLPDDMLQVPHWISLTRITDIPYVQGYDDHKDSTCEVECHNSRGGIAAFVDNYGAYQTSNPRIVGNPHNAIGALGVMFLIEWEGSIPLYRSRYVVTLRKGIRYPDDTWLSRKTMKPIVCPGHSDITQCRFIFQSREPNGHSSDVFVADFNGRNMFNITEDNVDAYDGLFSRDGTEVAEWVDARHIRYSSMQKGVRRVLIRVDPLYVRS